MCSHNVPIQYQYHYFYLYRFLMLLGIVQNHVLPKYLNHLVQYDMVWFVLLLFGRAPPPPILVLRLQQCVMRKLPIASGTTWRTLVTFSVLTGNERAIL